MASVGRFACCQVERINAYGETHPLWSSRDHTIAEGSNDKGAFGFKGGIELVPAEGNEDSIVLALDYRWTTPEQEHGTLNEKVRVTLHQPTEIDFGARCHLKVRCCKPIEQDRHRE